MAKTTERGNYFKKNDLCSIVLKLGGAWNPKDKMADLHDKIEALTRAAGPAGVPGTQEQKWGEWGEDIGKSLERSLQEAERDLATAGAPGTREWMEKQSEVAQLRLELNALRGPPKAKAKSAPRKSNYLRRDMMVKIARAFGQDANESMDVKALRKLIDKSTKERLIKLGDALSEEEDKGEEEGSEEEEDEDEPAEGQASTVEAGKQEQPQEEAMPKEGQEEGDEQKGGDRKDPDREKEEEEAEEEEGDDDDDESEPPSPHDEPGSDDDVFLYWKEKPAFEAVVGR